MGRQGGGGGGGGHRSMSATDKQRAFLQSVATEKLPTVKYSLFHGGCEVSLRDDAGNTALHIAALSNASKAMRILCDYCRKNDCKEELDLRTGDENKLTALMIAAKVGSIECCKELLYAGCDKNLKCERGYKAEQYARRNKNERLAKIIISGGEDEEEDIDEIEEDGNVSDDAPEGETSTQRSRRKKREMKLLDEERFGTLSISGGSGTETKTATETGNAETEKDVEEDDFDEEKAIWSEVKTTLKSMKSVTSSTKELYVKRELAPGQCIDPMLWKCTSLNLLSLHVTRTNGGDKDVDGGGDDDSGEVDNSSCSGIPVVPDGILSLTSLLTLILSDNQIETLPENFGHLSQLRCLEMNNNKVKELPSSFKNLTSLLTINLNNNKLTSIGALAKLENITSLQADSNQLTSIDDLNLKNKQRLETLSLSDNSLSTIPDDIMYCKQLKKLVLLDNKNLRAIPSTLWNIKKLQSIRINSNIDDNKINKMLKKHAKDGDDAVLIKELIPYLKKMSGSKKK